MGLKPITGGGVEDVSIRIDEVEEVIEVEEGDDIDIDVEVGSVDTRERRSIAIVERERDLSHRGDVAVTEDIESWEDNNIRWDRKLENVHCELYGAVGGSASTNDVYGGVSLDEGGDFWDSFSVSGGSHFSDGDSKRVEDSIGDGEIESVSFSGSNYNREHYRGDHAYSDLTITADVIVEKEAITDINIRK